MSTCMKALCRHVKQNKSQGGGGRSHMGPVYGTHPIWGGEGGVAGPGAYIYIYITVYITIYITIYI